MCANFRPASIDTFRDGVFADIRDTEMSLKSEVFPNEPAPIIRLELNAAGGRDDPIWTPARFGLVPYWVKEEQVAKLGVQRSKYVSFLRSKSQRVKKMLRQNVISIRMPDPQSHIFTSRLRKVCEFLAFASMLHGSKLTHNYFAARRHFIASLTY